METRLENKEDDDVGPGLVSSKDPFVSVVIPCRNEAGMIERCLQSVGQLEPPTGGMEIIVAEGMSEDGTREILARYEKDVNGQPHGFCGPFIRVIENPGKIVSTGLNAAIRAARGDIIVRMDAHTEFAPDYVRQCVAQMEKTGADNVGGPARTKPGTYIERAIAAAYHSPFSVGGARFHDIRYEGLVDTVTYGCWHKEVFERFGYFDEALVRNQDDEHNLRIVRGGGKVWQSPEIKSWYRPRGSLRGLFMQYMQYGYWKVPVIKKHQMPASFRQLVPGLCLLFLIASGVCSLFWVAGCVLFVGALLFYGTAVLAASVVTARRSHWNLLPLLPLVFPCYHFGYAYGFLCGIWDFALLRRTSKAKFKLLTR
jgi:glycosyltransferase involved in cell wall biosynthesis